MVEKVAEVSLIVAKQPLKLALAAKVAEWPLKVADQSLRVTEQLLNFAEVAKSGRITKIGSYRSKKQNDS